MSEGVVQDWVDFTSADGFFADNTGGLITPQMLRDLSATIVASLTGSGVTEEQVDDAIAAAIADYDIEVQTDISAAVSALESTINGQLATKTDTADFDVLAADAVLKSAISTPIEDFLGAATVEDAQAYLDLSVGVDVQAHSDDIDELVTGIAGLEVNDQMLYRDAAGAWHGVELDTMVSLIGGVLSVDLGSATVSDALQVLEDTPGPCNGRLSLTSGTPVTTSDVTGASNVYWVPYQGNLLWIYDGSVWVPYAETQKSVALSGLTNASKHDIFTYRASGVTKLGIGPAWSSSVTRSAAVSKLDGITVNTSSITMLGGDIVAANQATLLGTLTATSTTTTADTATTRNFVNQFNFFTTERQANDLIVNGQTLEAYTGSTNTIATIAYNTITVSAGTGAAGKALVLDANRDIGNIRNLTLTGRMIFPPYTFATVPAASGGGAIRITDRSGRLAYSDGTDWKWFADDAVIS